MVCEGKSQMDYLGGTLETSISLWSQWLVWWRIPCLRYNIRLGPNMWYTPKDLSLNTLVDHHVPYWKLPLMVVLNFETHPDNKLNLNNEWYIIWTFISHHIYPDIFHMYWLVLHSIPSSPPTIIRNLYVYVLALFNPFEIDESWWILVKATVISLSYPTMIWRPCPVMISKFAHVYVP